MNRISPKRADLYMERLGYVPRRPLTCSERIKCDLEVKQKLAKKRSNQWRRSSRSRIWTDAISAEEITAGSCTTASGNGSAHANVSTPKPEQEARSLIMGGELFSDQRSYKTRTGRVRAKGDDMTTLRLAAYLRAHGRCERELDGKPGTRCNRDAPWGGSVFTRGHLAHKAHGARKTDVLSEVEWSCAQCHLAEHGLQWNLAKAKPLSDKLFISYYAGSNCFCGADKVEKSALCSGCHDTLATSQPALLHVIDNGDGSALLKALGEFWQVVKSIQNTE